MKSLNELSNTVPVFVAVAGLVLACVSGAQADVEIETIPVGNSGNAGEWSGESYGGYGPDRICGAVGYTYDIGKYEVTAGQYTEFLNAVAATDTYELYTTSMSSSYGCKIQRSGSPDSYTYIVAGDWADRPVNYVSWGDAARFSNWLHNGQPGLDTPVPQDENSTEDGAYFLNGAIIDAQLLEVNRESDWKYAITSEDEWYKAAYHYNDGVTGNYFDYPTSSDSAPGYVTDSGHLSGTGDPFIEGGTDPGNYATYDGDGGIYGIGSPYYRTEVGEWENSDSPYGTFDQGGNVWEWNESILYDSSRGVRGGPFSSDDYALRAANRYSIHPSLENWSTGFRVAVPEPTTLSLLALGGLLVARRRR